MLWVVGATRSGIVSQAPGSVIGNANAVMEEGIFAN